MSKLGTKHIDLAGIEILPGHYVVYAASWDRSPILKYGIVTKLASRKVKSWVNGVYQDTTIATIGVITVDRNFENKWELQKDGKEMVLGFLDRLLVASLRQIPLEVLDILCKAYNAKAGR